MKPKAKTTKLLKATQASLYISLLMACDAHLPVNAQESGMRSSPPSIATPAPLPAPSSASNATPTPVKIRTPASIKADCNQPNFEKQILELVNLARSTARQCGGVYMPAVRPLQWDTRLQNTAALHSTDMARRDFFSHNNPDGKGFADRIQANGYVWKTAGETIASGQDTVAQVMKDWLISPPHCEQIMSASHQHAGAACVLDRKSVYVTFWTMSLGSE